MKEFIKKAIEAWKENNIHFEDIISNHPEIADRAIDKYFKEVIIPDTLSSINYRFYITMETILIGVTSNIEKELDKSILPLNGIEYSNKTSRYVRDRICSYHNCIEGFTITVKENIYTEFLFHLDEKLLMQ